MAEIILKSVDTPNIIIQATEGQFLKLLDTKADSETAGGGFAGGSDAEADKGFAGGANAITSDGVAAGYNAQTVDADGNSIDAIQLGEGTNTEPHTLQVYTKRIVDADGNLTAVGDLGKLNTSANKSVVGAINDVLVRCEMLLVYLGDVTNLTTNAQNSLVSAVNEVNEKSDSNYADIRNDIGLMADVEFRSESVTKMADALNYLYNDTEGIKLDLGDTANLSTDSKIVVDAINEISSNFKKKVNLQHITLSDLAETCLQTSPGETFMNFFVITEGYDAIAGISADDILIGSAEAWDLTETEFELRDNVYYIYGHGFTRIPASDKTGIISSDDTDAELELAYNTEVRYGELATLNITVPEEPEDDYISSIVFTSGETATNLVYPETIQMSGEGCIDGVFVPAANKRYTVILSYDGAYISGVVGGVSI